MTSTNQPTNELSNKRTGILNQLTMFLASFFIFALLAYSPTALAADFAGSLKGVTITDSAGTNTPPTAVINFTQNGDTVNFDASGSTDDGSIVEYRWDFGDNNEGVGSTVEHKYLVYGDFPVTLSIVDNMGGVHVVQQNLLII